MIGAIIGDIVGSRFEFNNAKSGNFTLFTKQCDFTDDTICTVAVADAILKGEDYKSSILHWCRKYPRPMGGYGGAFARWITSPDPQPYNSFGNGAAMRVSPVAWAFRSERDVIRQAIETAKISHDHMEGIIGAMVTALMIYYLQNHFWDDTIGMCNSVMCQYYGEDWESHLPPRGKFDETCQGCVPLAYHIVKQSNSFEDAIRNAILYGGDSDTLGAIVGSLAEAYFGIDIPMMQKALSYLPTDMKEVIQKFNVTYR